MRAAELVGFVWIQSGVDPAEHHGGAPGAGAGPDFVAAKRVARVDPDADDVTGLHALEIEGLERLIGNLWPAMRVRCRSGENEQPTRCDHANPERQMTRVYEVDTHSALSLIGPVTIGPTGIGDGAASERFV